MKLWYEGDGFARSPQHESNLLHMRILFMRCSPARFNAESLGSSSIETADRKSSAPGLAGVGRRASNRLLQT